LHSTTLYPVNSSTSFNRGRICTKREGLLSVAGMTLMLRLLEAVFTETDRLMVVYMELRKLGP
jgi:hypothetical protein